MVERKYFIVIYSMIVIIICMSITLVISIKSNQEIIRENAILSQEVSFISSQIEEIEEVKAEVEGLKYENTNLELTNNELHIVNNTFLPLIIEMMEFPLATSQQYSNPHIVTRKMKILDDETKMLVEYDTQLMFSPTLTSPYLVEIESGTTVYIKDKIEVRYLGNKSIWYLVDLTYNISEGVIKGWLPIESAKIYDKETDKSNNYISTKPKILAYHTLDEKFDLSNPIYIFSKKDGYILRVKEDYVLIMTSDGNLYWVEKTDIEL